MWKKQQYLCAFIEIWKLGCSFKIYYVRDILLTREEAAAFDLKHVCLLLHLISISLSISAFGGKEETNTWQQP
jgi:hypothetical protein